MKEARQNKEDSLSETDNKTTNAMLWHGGALLFFEFEIKIYVHEYEVTIQPNTKDTMTQS